MNENYKYYFKVTMNIILVALVLLLTLKFAIKTSPIIKLLALTINILTIFYAYKTIKNNTNNKNKNN